jgi:hypothetical protein
MRAKAYALGTLRMVISVTVARQQSPIMQPGGCAFRSPMLLLGNQKVALTHIRR